MVCPDLFRKKAEIDGVTFGVTRQKNTLHLVTKTTKQLHITTNLHLHPSNDHRPQTMTHFLILPLELRQQVLTYTFDNAALQDLHFNNLLLNTADILCGNKHIDNDLLPKKIYTPNIYDLAATLREIDPQLELDAIYALKQILPKFEFVLREHEDLATKIDEKRHGLALEWEDYTEVTDAEFERDGAQSTLTLKASCWDRYSLQEMTGWLCAICNAKGHWNW